MDAVFSRSELLEGIQTVQSIVSARAALPILSNILLEVEGTEARLSATDLEIGIRCKVQTTSSEDGSVTIHARRFSEIIRELPDSEIRITADPSSAVTITCERSRFKILGLPAEDFPPFPELEDGEKVVLEQGVLKDMIKKTIFATSTEETRYALNGILMEFKEGMLNMVATDTRRLALVKTPIPSEIGPRSAIVPTKAFQELSRILEDEGMVEIRLFGNQISFSTESVFLVSRLIEGQFPKYELVIPKSYDRRVRTSTEDLLRATRRVSLISTERASIVKVEFQPDRIILSASDPDVGEAVEEINASLEGDPLIMGYQARYITDVLRNVEKEEVCFELTGALSPAVLRPADDDNYLCLIMPVRT